MSLKKVKYLTLRDAAKHFDTTTDTLCDWLLDNPVRIEARSEYDHDNYHPLDEESWRPLLAAADKTIDRVVFKYPPEIKKFRLKGSSRFDDHSLSRGDLRISAQEVERIKDAVISDIGSVVTENYGVKKVRRTGRKWPTLHQAILSAAKELLKEGPEKYINKNRNPVVAKLAKGLHEQRNRWPDLAGEPLGTSHRNFTEVLGKMRSHLKVPKITEK
ncbi:MAG: hypothetical protein IPL83_15770 [Bdellovibrionales bacterium]|nr:hypothetical protein [Bdellovibrionales bacterium]